MGSALSDFKNFVLKGDVVSLAVGIVIGIAFQAVVTGMVGDMVTPLIGVPGHLNFHNWNVTVNGSTFQPGAFLNALISFLLVALVVFFLVVRPYEKMRSRYSKPAAAPVVTTRDCPYCCTAISRKASRCPNCTSQVDPLEPAPQVPPGQGSPTTASR